MTVDPQIITDTLKLTPSRLYRKGDTWISKHGGSLCTRPRTVWAIDSDWTTREDEDETLSHHFEYFKKVLLPKAELLRQYKEDKRYELSFWITIRTDDAGFSLDLTEEELNFFNEFSSRLVVSMTAGCKQL